MKLEQFGRQLAVVRERAEWLRGHASREPALAPQWLSEAVRELSAAMAELQQAEADLRLEMEAQRQSQAAVEAERQRYRSLFEFAPDGYLVTDLNACILEANWAAGILLNTSEETLVGKPLGQFVLPEDYEAFEARIRGLDRVDGVREWETRLQAHDYAAVDVSLTVAPERQASGQVTALRWLVRDITARKQAAEEVRALNAELEQRVLERTAQLEAANRQLKAEIEDRRRAEYALRARARQQAVVAGLGHKGLAGIDLTALMETTVNLVARTLDVEYCRLLELLPDGQSLVVRASIGWPKDAAARQVPPGGDPQAEYTLRARAPVITGDLAAEARFTPAAEVLSRGLASGLSVAVHGRGGSQFGVLAAHTRRRHAFATDDTNFLVAVANVLSATLERQRSEAEIRKLNAELEGRVAERTRELKAKNQELETFTYSVSHDLKAPLRGIDGYSRLLLEDYAGQLDGQGRDSLQSIRRAVQQMNQLIDDLLAYARLERRSLAPGRVNLVDLVDMVIAERAEELERRPVSLSVKVPCQTVSGDSDGLAQALRNLLDNALKFTAGRPDARIEFGGRDLGDRCCLWVRDNGIGFDMLYADRIFGIFQRLHRAEDYDGTGIGLAIVQKAMQRMQGRAWAESAPGQGASFYLEMPK